MLIHHNHRYHYHRPLVCSPSHIASTCHHIPDLHSSGLHEAMESKLEQNTYRNVDDNAATTVGLDDTLNGFNATIQNLHSLLLTLMSKSNDIVWRSSQGDLGLLTAVKHHIR